MQIAANPVAGSAWRTRLRRVVYPGAIMAGVAIVLLLDVRFLWSLLSQGCTRTHHTLAQAQIATFAGKLESFRHDSGRMPESLEELTRPVFAGPYAHERELSDPWGRRLYYRVEDEGRRFVLFSLGEDGRLGGEDQSEDISYLDPDPGN